MRLGLALFSFLIVVLAATSARTETLVFATGEWRPYTSEDMEDLGDFTRLVSLVVAEMGYEAEFVFYPWPRCYDAVIKGRVWAAFPYSYTEGRAQEVWYSDPMDVSRSLLFAYEPQGQERDVEFETLEDLAGYRVGGVHGYFYQEMFEQAGLEVDYVNSEIQGMEKLMHGRIDLFPVNDKVGWDIISTNFPEEADNFHTLAKPLSENELMIIVSRAFPDSARLLEEFNAALQRCRDKGLIPE